MVDGKDRNLVLANILAKLFHFGRVRFALGVVARNYDSCNFLEKFVPGGWAGFEADRFGFGVNDRGVESRTPKSTSMFGVGVETVGSVNTNLDRRGRRLKRKNARHGIPFPWKNWAICPHDQSQLSLLAMGIVNS